MGAAKRAVGHDVLGVVVGQEEPAKPVQEEAEAAEWDKYDEAMRTRMGEIPQRWARPAQTPPASLSGVRRRGWQRRESKRCMASFFAIRTPQASLNTPE